MSEPTSDSNESDDADIELESDTESTPTVSTDDELESLLDEEDASVVVVKHKKPPAKKTTKTKEKKTMPVEREDANGLKGVKAMLKDQVEVNFMQNMIKQNQQPQKSVAEELKELFNKTTPVSPPPAPVAQPMMMGMGMDTSKMTPEQQTQMMMMQNPQMYMMNMMMQMMMTNMQKNPDNGMQGMKDMAEVMTALAQMNKPKDESRMMEILLAKALEKPAQSDNQNRMFELVITQLNSQLEYYKNKSESNAPMDPIDFILASRDKYQQLASVLGNKPEDAEIRRKEWDFNMMERQREMEIAREERLAALEERKSAKKEGMLEKGIDTVLKTIVSPIMDSVKRGYEAQASGVGPRMFDPLPNTPPLDGEQLPNIPPLPNTNVEVVQQQEVQLPPPPSPSPPRAPIVSPLSTIRNPNRRVPFGNPTEGVN